MTQFKLIEKETEYTGSQLSPHWIYNNFDLKGDCIVAFMGPCSVDINSMVDLADVKNNDTIYSPLMLHFIMEFFDDDLYRAIYRQRLFIVHIKEKIENSVTGKKFVREGDDIYLLDGDRRKLSVSIATRSMVSTLIHVGINIDTEGTPVKTSGLRELDIEPVQFAKEVVSGFIDEIEEIRFARCKVRGV